METISYLLKNRPVNQKAKPRHPKDTYGSRERVKWWEKILYQGNILPKKIRGLTKEASVSKIGSMPF